MRTWLAFAVTAAIASATLPAFAGPVTTTVAQSTVQRSEARRGDPIVNVPGSIKGVRYQSLTAGKPVTPQALFGAKLQPQGLDAHQGRFGDKSGHAGDCYMIATMAGYAEFQPHVIKNVFLERNGQLRTSPGGRPAAQFYVKDRASGDFKPADPAIYDGRAPVRTEMNKLAFGKLVDKSRIWSPMMEYSYTKFRNQQGGAVHSKDADYDRTGWNRTANGGYPNHVMQALSGKPADTVYVDAHNGDEVWEKLKAAQNANKIVVVGSLAKADMKERVREEIADGHRDGRARANDVDEDRWVDGHAFTAWGNADKPFLFERNGERMIRLRNPWGVSAPGGKGLDGVGEITFKQFLLRYDRAWISGS